MKTVTGLVLMAGLAVVATTAMAQDAPTLEIALHPVIRVTGEVGATYVIESATEVDSDFWLTRGWIELTTPTAEWRDPVATDSLPRFYRAVKATKPLVQTIPNMVWIPPGRFTMGSPGAEQGRDPWEGPQTRVTLTKGYWMGKYEVTQREYLEAMSGMGENPCYDPTTPGDLDLPVRCVTWGMAVAYCQELTEQERTAGRLPTGYVYRLPTEAEWEYACRAGTTTRFSFGDTLGCSDGCEYCPLLDSYMWWCGNSGRQTHRVGGKLPNPWGLHDAHGNMAEWCRDWWSESIPGGAVTDPQGPNSGSLRVFRGSVDWASLNNSARLCRSALRFGDGPDYRDHVLGFRAVLAPGQ